MDYKVLHPAQESFLMQLASIKMDIDYFTNLCARYHIPFVLNELKHVLNDYPQNYYQYTTESKHVQTITFARDIIDIFSANHNNKMLYMQYTNGVVHYISQGFYCGQRRLVTIERPFYTLLYVDWHKYYIPYKHTKRVILNTNRLQNIPDNMRIICIIIACTTLNKDEAAIIYDYADAF